MHTEQKNEKTFVKSVTELYQNQQLFQKLLIGSLLINVLLGVCVNGFLMSDPIVILEKDEEKLSFVGKKREVTITDNEIQKIVERFIRKRYEWDSFSEEKIMDGLNTIITGGLKEKIALELNKQSQSYKAISQYVGKIQMTVDGQGNVVAMFDKVIRITGKKDEAGNLADIVQKIPLLSEAQILVKVVRSRITDENPLGIYINTVMNYETN